MDEKAKILFTVTSTGDFVHHSHNERFRVWGNPTFLSDDFASQATTPTHGGTPAPEEVDKAFLRFTVDHSMKDERLGFVFGRDTATCDVYINTASKRFFTVQFNPVIKSIILKNLSTYGINMSSERYGKIKIKTQRALLPNDTTTVFLPDDVVILELADHSNDHLQYLEQFFSRLSRALPSLGTLNLASIPPSSTVLTAAQGARHPYVFQAKIGNGAFGTVYRAVHSYTGATFAVKEIHKLGKQSLREPAILQSLSHRNIVKFIEFISMDQDNTMIVMELVHGLNLEILHAQSPFTLDDTRELATEMLFGLDYLHSNRITHRDLKPANILVPQRNPIHIKITDFGLAVARSQQLKTNCGTALYLAPEVLSEACYTNKVDLWSLGVIALELVLGLPDYPKGIKKKPCWTERLIQRLDYAMNIDYYNFVKSLLRILPDDRPPADQILLEDSFLNNRDASQTPTEQFPTPKQYRSQDAPSPPDWPLLHTTEIFASPSDHAEPSGHTAPPTEISNRLVPTEIPDHTSPPTQATQPQNVNKQLAATASYWILRSGTNTVLYMARPGRVNVTHICQICRSERNLPWRDIDKSLGKINRIIMRGKGVQGSYVTFADAYRIIAFFRLKTDLVDQLVKQVKSRGGKVFMG